MNVDRHYDEETLISFLGSSGEIHKRDPHLASCLSCSESLDQYRAVVDVLGDKAVWDLRELKEDPVPQTIANLRAFATTMSHEDTLAAPMVAELLAGPREWWANKLRHHPEYRTPGVVRKLLEASDKAIDTMPPDAVEITALAVDIAESLAPATHTSDAWAKLRGAAWRDRGYALFYVGRFSDSLEAVQRAEEAFKSCAVADFDLARVGIVRALAERGLEKTSDALRTSRHSAECFSDFGAADRVASAMSIEASMYSKAGDYRTALTIWSKAEKIFPATEMSDARARLISNIAHAHWHLGNFAEALSYFHLGTAVQAEMGVVTEVARNGWMIANVLLAAGRTDEAFVRLDASRKELERLGMNIEVALASLDLAELYLDRGQTQEVESMCQSALEQFRRSGVAYSERAMRAIAYLREAAEQRKATRDLVREVRQYVQRLPQQPTAIFLPLPD